MSTIALCIPHLPDGGPRDASLDRWHASPRGGSTDYFRVLTDRKPNREWARDMWRWGLETGAEFFLTLQDDVEVAPCFLPALKAILTHVPKGAALGLSAVHPLGPEMHRQGHRFYRTRSWLVGWAYGLWREDLAALIEYEKALCLREAAEEIKPLNEDDVVNHFVTDSGRFSWHPVPTICDHDTSIDSHYGNDHHVHRRATVRWDAFEYANLSKPEFWLPQWKAPPLLPVPAVNHCWWCLQRAAKVGSNVTGMAICGACVGKAMAALVERIP